MIVIDEADFFFGDDRNLKQMQGILDQKMASVKDKLQYVLFSATYSDGVR